MAAIATPLVEFSDSANSRTYSAPGHTVSKPRVVIQKRKVPTGTAGVAENSLKVVFGTTDSVGAPIPANDSIEVIWRVPVNGTNSDAVDALALFRELVASNEFTAAFLSQNYVK